jgi:colicin import membrane protein
MSEALSIAPVTGAPTISQPAGEPSMADLAALLPDPSGEALPGAERGNIPSPPMHDEPAKAEDAAKAEEAEAPVDTEALSRAEAAAKKAREGSRRYREALDAQRRVQAEAQRAAQEAAENRRRAEEASRFQEELRRDPYAALKKLGMTDQELAERALREGTPENELRTLFQRQQEALEFERQRREQLEQRLESERQAAVRQQAEANFHRLADDERAYPRLAQLAPTAQLAVAKAALQQIASNGYEVGSLSDADVAEACERFLAPKKAAKAAPAAPKAAAPPKSSGTLTNSVTAARATAPRPWEELSDDEQIAAIAAALPDLG